MVRSQSAARPSSRPRSRDGDHVPGNEVGPGSRPPRPGAGRFRRRAGPGGYSALVSEVLRVPPQTFITVDVEDYFREIPGCERYFERLHLPSNLPPNVATLLDL